ncbi:aromatic-ring-hydroxylating dioxygenase subunit beta [Actinomycetospora corticicola]|uniref:3-phenylpropionate/cinnamic acid dioxygenase small subunit n=1 Tax=Actinomycetospora corticicola TaxID=663602 RepID=A0A7Y9E2D8_9PSEU|nr:aromatic-ring-hydroxylating dioxygenase subunit beta [Actinomycetospora corticicola]NYD39747.1 3-phenylpropionate/cinnamic acid dioxygenase small subunit [Actinomycetospora corticicola]
MTAAAQQIVDGTPPPVGPAAGVGDPIALAEAEAFLYREARLADGWELEAWEALWTDDATYYVPVDDTQDPRSHMSIIFDNRNRIATRIKQLQTGKRHSQRPLSRLCRSVTNVEVLGQEGGDTVVTSVVQVLESRDRGSTWWVGRVTHRLRRVDGELRMAGKKVVLVDSDRALPSMSFLL